MPDWLLAVIGIGIVAAICLCGELARCVEEDDDAEKRRLRGQNLQRTRTSTYLGAPVRLRFEGFDIESTKTRGPREEAHLDDLPPLDTSEVSLPGSDMTINLTPRDNQGNEKLVTSAELTESASRPRAIMT